MDQFWEEFEAGEIHFRDKWQFELKSEFSPDHGHKQSEYTQEFYIFIPAALQINSQSYSKDEFFRAETNLIRFQTPDLTFTELLSPKFSNSPLAKLQVLLQESVDKPTTLQAMELELKLFANIFRKTLRHTVRPLIESIEQSESREEIALKTRKLAINEKYRSLIGGFAAALAMFLYLMAFIWQGSIFVINSFPFVLITVILYVIKDRLKEELKNLSYKHVFRWFPDYTTEITLPSERPVIGRVHESFSFINEQQVPLEIQQLRNQGFHTYLEMIKRQEEVIYFKKKVIVYERKDVDAPLQGLSIIFRFNLKES